MKKKNNPSKRRGNKVADTADSKVKSLSNTVTQYFAKLSFKQKIFHAATVVLVILALFDRIFLGPVLSKLKAVGKEVDTQEFSIDRDAKFLLFKDKILKDNKIYGEYFVDKVPEQDVVNTEFFRILEHLARRSQVNLTKTSPDEPRTNKKTIEYFASIDCVGKLEDIIAFMHEINSTEKELMKIVKFNMTSKRGTSSEVNASMKIVKVVMTPDMSN